VDVGTLGSLKRTHPVRLPGFGERVSAFSGKGISLVGLHTIRIDDAEKVAASGFLLAPILAGVLVKAIRFLNQTAPSSMPTGSG
jgi:hypothetical protein